MDTHPVTEGSAQPSSPEARERGMQRGPGAGLAQDHGAAASGQQRPGDREKRVRFLKSSLIPRTRFLGPL